VVSDTEEPPRQSLITQGKLLLTPIEAAETLSISRSLLYDLIMHKRIYNVKVGNARRIPCQALRAYVDALCGSDAQKVG